MVQAVQTVQTTQPEALVEVDEPERMSLLGLLMAGLLRRSMADEAARARVRSLRGDIAVRAGQMEVTLRFTEAGLRIVRGRTERPRARVEGSLGALVDVVTGEGFIGPVLRGSLKIGGNPLVLLRMLPLIRA